MHANLANLRFGGGLPRLSKTHALSGGRAHLEVSGLRAHQVCSPGWRSQWRALEHACVDQPPPVNLRRASGHHAEVSGLRFLGGGHLAFEIVSRARDGRRVRAAGDSYTVWLRRWPSASDQASATVTAAFVRDQLDGTHLAVARVPDAGRYALTVQLDWAMCGGLREDPLRNDSSVGFQLVEGGVEDASAFARGRLREFERLEAAWPYLGERAAAANVTVSAADLEPRPGGCQPVHRLAPGAFRLRPARGGASGGTWQGSWVRPPCACGEDGADGGRGGGSTDGTGGRAVGRRRRPAPLRLRDVTHLGLLGDSRLGNLAGCLTATEPTQLNSRAPQGICAEVRRSAALAVQLGLPDEAAAAALNRLETVHGTLSGLYADQMLTVDALRSFAGVACQWRLEARLESRLEAAARPARLQQAAGQQQRCGPRPQEQARTNVPRLLRSGLSAAGRCRYRFVSLGEAWRACSAHALCDAVVHDGGITCDGAANGGARAADDARVGLASQQRMPYELRRGTAQRGPQGVSAWGCDRRRAADVEELPPFTFSSNPADVRSRLVEAERLCARAAAEAVNTTGGADGSWSGDDGRSSSDDGVVSLLVLNVGAHAVQRSRFAQFRAFIDAAAEAMVADEARGLTRWAYATSAAIHEYTLYGASGGEEEVRAIGGRSARRFATRHWRLTDARLRLFDGYAAEVMQAHGLPVLDHYWPTKAWPKIVSRETTKRLTLAKSVPSPAGATDGGAGGGAPAHQQLFNVFAERAGDIRHHAKNAIVGVEAGLPW